MTAHFDEYDEESWYFGKLSFSDATALLQNEEVGSFLVRDSSQSTGYVLCVKEKIEVAQYPIKSSIKESETNFFIRDELKFRDLPSMLSFYKRNLFESTSLIRPIKKEGNNLIGSRASEIPAQITPKPRPRERPGSAPPNMMDHTKLARVIKSRYPSAYLAKTELELHIGDVIRVTQIKNGNGEGEIGGKTGKFPLTHVELIEPKDG